MIIEEDNYVKHYGILRRSGRYPWGSSGWGTGGDKPAYPWSGGATVAQRSKGFLDYVREMSEKGLSEKQIAEGVGLTELELRAVRTNAKNEYKASQVAQVQRLKDKGTSIAAIARRMEMPEATVRSYLKPGADDRAQNLRSIRELLKEKVDSGSGFVDVGSGLETQLNVSREKIEASLVGLKDLGYTVHNVPMPQLTGTKNTTTKVLAKAGVDQKKAFENRLAIEQVFDYSTDGGRTFLGIHKPLSVDSKRLQIAYDEDGGSAMDGVVYVREGVKDLSLGGGRYGQVRIMVDDTHFIKGMAIYKEGLPDGVDLVFNTNKSREVEKKGPLAALKPLNEDPDNPFKTSIKRQITENVDGEVKVTSAMNIVYNEGDWINWRDSLSPQVLSKQDPKLAKAQLDIMYERQENELKEIKALTNPVVKQKLLQQYADSVDSKAVDLKAAKMPGQAWQVILPIASLKDNEVYAPRYADGEEVVLIRYPHGGVFEIPRLTVNNKNREANKIMGKEVKDAIGINSEVANRLSGADFDGDTVLVIPDKGGRIRTSAALEGLKDFDPVRAYPSYPGMKVINPSYQQKQMGVVSNLITDMTLRGASTDKIARAVRHSMVIIDAAKHELNWKESEKVNGIAALKAEFQKDYNESGSGGAGTLISRAKSPKHVNELKARPQSEGGHIDPKTGRLILVESGNTKVNRQGERVPKTEKRPKLSLVEDAYDLIDGPGTRMEKVYADHANRMKGLGNQARLELLATKPAKVNPSPATRATYKDEVGSLQAKVALVKSNRPRERQAQTIANTIYSAKAQDNPAMDESTKRKVKSQALMEARVRVGLSKHPFSVTPREWEAIQAGVVSNTTLKAILAKADMDEIRSYATPKKEVLMTSAKSKRARQMMDLGYTRAEVAQHLGVSVGTLDRDLYGT